MTLISEDFAGRPKPALICEIFDFADIEIKQWAMPLELKVLTRAEYEAEKAGRDQPVDVKTNSELKNGIESSLDEQARKGAQKRQFSTSAR